MPRLSTVCAVALLALSSMSAQAQPATARYAAGQLRSAEALLKRAENARARGEYEQARRLAAQAQIDARLAWAMSDSDHMRSAVSRVYGRVAILEQRLDAARGSLGLIRH